MQIFAVEFAVLMYSQNYDGYDDDEFVLTLLILTFEIVRFVVGIIFGFFFDDDDVDDAVDDDDDNVFVLLIGG